MRVKKVGGKVRLKIFGMLFGMLLGVTLGVPAWPQSASTVKEVVWGALLDLTGDWSSLGESSQVALDLAQIEINDYLSTVHSSVRIKLAVEDTGGDPAIALEKLKLLVTRGVRVVIGPQSSAEVEAIRNYADQSGVLVISQGSTAHSLAIPGDNVFRFCSDDVSEGELMAGLMWEAGIRAVVPLWRDDAGNEGLYLATKNAFQALGGTVCPDVKYSPGRRDFAVSLTSLDSQVEQVLSCYGAGRVAVYLTGFDEVVLILAGAAQYGNLCQVSWYGSNGVALSQALISDREAARFAASSGYPCPIFGLEARARDHWKSLAEEIRDKLGRDPDGFTLAAYDALWVTTVAYLLAEETDECQVLKAALVAVASRYYGATGWTVLNQAGDRKFSGYDLWSVRESGGRFEWQRVKN